MCAVCMAIAAVHPSSGDVAQLLKKRLCCRLTTRRAAAFRLCVMRGCVSSSRFSDVVVLLSCICSSTALRSLFGVAAFLFEVCDVKCVGCWRAMLCQWETRDAMTFTCHWQCRGAGCQWDLSRRVCRACTHAAGDAGEVACSGGGMRAQSMSQLGCHTVCGVRRSRCG